MKMIIYILILMVFVSCDSTDKNKIRIDSEKNILDTSIIEENTLYPNFPSKSPDTVLVVKNSVVKLESIRKNIKTQFLFENPLMILIRDTIIDFNYDGEKDYVIDYYESVNTGISNKSNIYIFNKKKNNYIFDEIISDISNPTFYIDQKKITGFYIGYGSGDGIKLEWINDEWMTTKEFEVENEGDSSKWIIYFPRKEKTEIIIKPFEMIPPNDILESKFNKK